jgi:transcriptional regulator with XRE-family HTH domain
MVRTKRRKPVLARKLRQIRVAMDLSQNEMICKMGLEGSLLREEVSDFERNKRIPPLEVVLQYARVANVFVEALIDDQLDLPERMPAKMKSGGMKHKAASKETRTKARRS